MKKNIFQISALVLILGLSFANCHSKSDNSLYQTNSLLFNYINDLLSGNCSVIEKYTNAAGVSTYVATGYNVPKGGCSAGSLGNTYTSVSTTSIVEKTDAYFTKITDFLDTIPACTTISTGLKGNNANLNAALTSSGVLPSAGVGLIKSLTTATNIATAAAANSTADTETRASNILGPKNCRTVKIGLLYTAGVYCTTAADATAAQEKVRYTVVDSVIKDMNVNLEANRGILIDAKTGDVNYFTKSAVNSLRMMTTAEVASLTGSTTNYKADAYALQAGIYSTLAAAGGAGAVIAGTLGVPSCLAALTAAEPALKDILIRIPFAYALTTINTNVSFADRQAVTTPYLPYLYCRYGTGVTATSTVSTSSTPGQGICPSSYPSF